jgi:alcohol dehydrogenase
VKEIMRALVYHGPGRKAWEETADPEITDDLDAIVRVDTVTICALKVVLSRR